MISQLKVTWQSGSWNRKITSGKIEEIKIMYGFYFKAIHPYWLISSNTFVILSVYNTEMLIIGQTACGVYENSTIFEIFLQNYSKIKN